MSGYAALVRVDHGVANLRRPVITLTLMGAAFLGIGVVMDDMVGPVSGGSLLALTLAAMVLGLPRARALARHGLRVTRPGIEVPSAGTWQTVEVDRLSTVTVTARAIRVRKAGGRHWELPIGWIDGAERERLIALVRSRVLLARLGVTRISDDDLRALDEATFVVDGRTWGVVIACEDGEGRVVARVTCLREWDEDSGALLGDPDAVALANHLRDRAAEAEHAAADAAEAEDAALSEEDGSGDGDAYPDPSPYWDVERTARAYRLLGVQAR